MNDKEKERISISVAALLAVLVPIIGLFKCSDDSDLPPNDVTTMEKATMPNHTKKQQNVFAQSDEDTLSHIVGKQPSPNYLRHCGKSHTGKRQMVPRLEPSDSAQLTTPIPSTHMKETQPSEDSQKTIHNVTTVQDGHASVAAIHHSHFPRGHVFRIGLYAGVGYASVSHLGGIVEGFDIRPRFSMDERGMVTPTIGLQGIWQHRRLGAELGVSYVRLGGRLSEYKWDDGIHETTDFHYGYLIPRVGLRMYVLPELYMGAGVGLGISLGGNGVDFGDDRQGEVHRQQAQLTQDHLRGSLRGKVLALPFARLGYHSPGMGLGVALEYGFGIGDLLKTRDNDYGYHNPANTAQYVTLTIGYELTIGKRKKSEETTR